MPGRAHPCGTFMALSLESLSGKHTSQESTPDIFLLDSLCDQGGPHTDFPSFPLTCLYLSITHTHNTHKHTHAHTRSLSLSVSQSHTQTHTHTHTQTQERPLLLQLITVPGCCWVPPLQCQFPALLNFWWR